MATGRKPVPGYIRFPIGGISGIGATLVIHPVELVKFRMQLNGEGGVAADHRTWFHAFKSITEKEGFLGLYAGLSANILHQAIYATVRMGIYQTILDRLRLAGHDTLLYHVPAAMAGGTVGSALGTPAEVVLVRMTADGRLDPSKRRNYKHVFNALGRIYAEEGTKGLFTGFKPTIIRANVANVSQLVSYTRTKEFLIREGYTENNVKCHFASSIVSGFMFAFTTCPIDLIKTRIQTMQLEHPPLYKGILDALVKTVRKEGVLALWKGFMPFYARCAPHTILLFIFVEQLTFFYRKYCVDLPGLDY